jgi:sporulation protein YlmC with PRC-barrel domain
MKTLTLTAALLALTTVAASAQAPERAQPTGPAVQVMTTIPANSSTITHWYKQNVYDPADNKIGEIEDVLINREGTASALIIGVGGFLGIGEKHVAVPFNAVQVKTKDNNKWYMVMNTTKDALKSAKGFKYDRSAMTWGPEDAATTGGGTPAPAPAPRR